MLTLSAEDGRAVDVFLDTLRSRHDNEFGSVASELAGENIWERVQCAGKVLGLLDELPADEPPDYLLANIMQAVRTTDDGRAPLISQLLAGKTENQAQLR